MKRYIKASISNSCPDWLRKAFTSRYFGGIKDALLRKYSIAIDRANFTDSPTGANSIPIYLLQTDFGDEIYCPGANDSSTAYINGRQRTLGKIAKSKLPEMAIDTVYVDLDDPTNIAPARHKYRDPRYSYRNSSRGEYAGQYKRRDYLGLNNGESEYGPEYWSTSGKHPSNESRSRDKSGYIVPSPQEMLAKYYSKFPNAIRNKIDRIYERISDVKSDLMSADFNRPLDTEYGQDVYSDAYRKFSDVVREYRRLFNYLNEAGELKSYDLIAGDGYYARQISSSIRDISQMLNEIEDLIG